MAGLRFRLQFSETLASANYVNTGNPLTTDQNGAATFSVLPPVSGTPTGFFRAYEVP